MIPTSAAGETPITFCGELWAVEVARLLLEVDEGWVGYHQDTTWHWHEETYTVFAAICCDRTWPCNSKAACMAMLQAMRTGLMSTSLSQATRSSDGYAQWSLDEMRELGAHMRRVVDDESRALHWMAQLDVFMQLMTTRDATYTIRGRTIEDFAARAGKFVPARTLLLIESDSVRRYDDATIRTVVSTTTTRKTPSVEPEQQIRWANCRNVTLEPKQRTRRVTHVQAMEDSVDSADESLWSLRNIHKKDALAARKRGRNTDIEPFQDEDVLWQDNQPDGMSASVEQVLPLPFEGSEQLTASSQRVADIEKLSCPLDTMDPRWPLSLVEQKQGTAHQDQPSPTQASLCQESTTPMQESSTQTGCAQASFCQHTADQEQPVDGIRNSAAATKQPTRKCQRVQQLSMNDRVTGNGHTSSTMGSGPSRFRKLNPYDRPGKLWGEFVVEVLLAERTASNADELDYVQFIRGLYEI